MEFLQLISVEQDGATDPVPKGTKEKGEENHFRKHGGNTAGLVANQIIPKQFYKHLVQIFFMGEGTRRGRKKFEVQSNSLLKNITIESQLQLI